MNAAGIRRFEDTVLGRLTAVERPAAARFAAACAERLAPIWERNSAIAASDRPLVRAALDLAWADTESGIDPDDFRSARDMVVALAPDDEDPGWSRATPLLQNALAAVVFALDARSGDVASSAWAARQVFEAVDCIQQWSVLDEYVAVSGDGPAGFLLDGVQSALSARVVMSASEMRSEAELDGERLLTVDGVG